MKNVFMAGVFITLLFCGSPSLSWATSSHTVETVQQKQVLIKKQYSYDTYMH